MVLALTSRPGPFGGQGDLLLVFKSLQTVADSSYGMYLPTGVPSFSNP